MLSAKGAASLKPGATPQDIDRPVHPYTSAESASHPAAHSQSQTNRSSKSTPCFRSNSRHSSWNVRVRWCSYCLFTYSNTESSWLGLTEKAAYPRSQKKPRYRASSALTHFEDAFFISSMS